jgi:hypothetical protein
VWREVPGVWLTSNERLYAGFQLPYCIVTDLIGAPISAWIWIQFVLYGVACVLVYDTARRLIGPTAGLVAGASLAILWETFRWAIRPQSDLLFVVALALSLWALGRYHQHPTNPNRVLALGSLGWLAITRPFGLPILLGWLVYDMLPQRSNYRFDLFFRGRVNIAILVLVVAYALTTSDFQPGGELQFGLQRFWEPGIVVTHPGTPTFQYHYTPRPASNMLEFAVYNADHLFLMGILKIVWFFAPFLSRWSVTHVLTNAFTLAPLMLGGLVGAIKLLLDDRRLFQLWVTPLIMLLLTVGVTYLDGGFSYRAPAGPIFALLTGYVVASHPSIERRIDRYIEWLETGSVERWRGLRGSS